MNGIFLYRIGNFCIRYRIPVIPTITKYINFLLFNSFIPPTAKIGNKVKLAYGGIGVVIHSKSEIGEKVIIGQGVTIGRALEPNGVPKIGNNVYIGTGAKILGKIIVGNNVIIGANAVVINDIEDNSIVAGVPAKNIRKINISIWELLENLY